MLRIFPGVCRLPNDAARRLVLPHPPASLACPAFLAVAVCSLVGCSTQQFGLAEQAKIPNGTGANLVASTSLSTAPAASVDAAAAAPSDVDRPNVSRLQKPESEPSKRPG